MLNHFGQAGATLIELMVGMVVGLIVIAGVINIFLVTGTNSSDIMLSARLSNEMSSSISVMIDEIRRAGFWGTASAGDINNPFTQSTTDLQILDSGNCILYTYDRDQDGTVDAEEYFGFKMASGAIQMRMTGTTTSDCTNGTWEAISDSDITTITGLTFSTTGYECVNSSTDDNWSSTCDDAGHADYVAPTTGDVMIEIRQVDITLVGALASDTFVAKEYQESVRVRNDRFYEAP